MGEPRSSHRNFFGLFGKVCLFSYSSRPFTYTQQYCSTRRTASAEAATLQASRGEVGVPKLRDFQACHKNGERVVENSPIFRASPLVVQTTPPQQNDVSTPPVATRDRQNRRTTVIIPSKTNPGIFTLTNAQGEQRNYLFLDTSVSGKAQDPPAESSFQDETKLEVPPLAAKSSVRRRVARYLEEVAEETRQRQIGAAVKWPKVVEIKSTKNAKKLRSRPPPRRIHSSLSPPLPPFPKDFYFSEPFGSAALGSGALYPFPSMNDKATFATHIRGSPLSELQLW